jgi:CheY-like chemotaxis protein
MKKISILWVDDEVDQLKSHLIFLEQRNYEVTTCLSGRDAINLLEYKHFDIIFLDENMPGLTGLETLLEISRVHKNIPVVMITRNEEESIMEEAIGSKIADYLIKPVNPHQILISLKKNLDHSRIVNEKTTINYQQEFRNITLEISEVNDYEGWISVYKKLIYWELQLEEIEDSGVLEILEAQKTEANQSFSKYIEREYPKWLNGAESPVLSHTLFQKLIAPRIVNEKTIFILIDNLRLDHWQYLEKCIGQNYRKTFDSAYFSILPTATQYARNAIFSGLTPLEMRQKYPNWWRDDYESDGKNLFESQFFEEQLQRVGLNFKWQYHKVNNSNQGKQVIQTLSANRDIHFMAVVYNFVDILSHAKTEIELLKELASSEKAYRSLILSWFKNSPLLELIQLAQKKGYQLIITTDHGTINVKQASQILGDRDTSSNLRYKTAKSLTFDKKDVIHCKEPKKWQLPQVHFNSTYAFAKNNSYFVYPNNFNHFARQYRNTYQHGGISLEEMIIPFAVFKPV